MRLVLLFVFILALAVGSYVAVTGYFLARAATGLLTVGNISTALATATPPTDPLALGYRGNPMLALGLRFQTVSVATDLGPVEAWLVPAEGAEIGRAVYVHGIAGAREDGYRHLKMLHEAGYSVLLMTYRNDPGAPETANGLYGFGLTEWPDLEAAILTVTGPDGPRVLVVAESMGGAVLGQFLAQSTHAGLVKAVILDSPAVSYNAVIQHLARQGANPLPDAMAWAASLMTPRMTDLPLHEAEVAATYAAYPGPLFLAHGSGDRIVPIGPSQDLAAARTAPTVTLWTTADHLGSYTEDPQAYSAAFRDFLSQIGG
jgi:alpha-beta hydrolase superfamily lysophospholipase